MFESKKMVSMLFAMVVVLSIGCVSVFADVSENQIDTLSRGYQLIDGNICDLDGNLLIKLENGFTADGYTVDPNFRVHYPELQEAQFTRRAIKRPFINEDTKAILATTIFSGTKNLYLNTDGNQGVQCGSNFTVSSSEPRVDIYYSSGIPTGVNLAVHNVTRGTIVDWVSNVQKGNYSLPIYVYNSSRPSDVYKAMVSAEGMAGSASIIIEKW